MTEWQPIETAPKDGTLIALLIEQIDYDDNDTPHSESHSTSDVAPGEMWATFGFSQFKDTGDDVWQFAGWDWCSDEFTAGHGVPKFWQPFPTAK